MQSIAEVMVQNVAKIDAILGKISFKSKQILTDS